MSRPRRYVIVGNGVAGATAALTLRARDDRADISMVSDEGPYFFSRTALMYAFMDRLPRRAMEPFERKVWDEQRITRVTERVTDLDVGAGALRTKGGTSIPFDRLLLATGSTPRRLEAEGLSPDTDGLVHFVTMQDLDACERWAPTTREAVVVGGGLIGIELVECLLHHGVKTTFLVREPWYWPVALCREEGDLITEHMRAMGADVRLGVTLEGVERDASGRVSGVRTSEGEALPAQMLGVSIGVVPRVEWLREAKTPPRLNRGILVDDALKTSLDGVWAAGDCAEIEWPDRPAQVEQIWYSAKRQGELAARNMSGPPARYAPPVFFNSAKFFEVEYTTVGELTRVPEGSMSVYRAHPTKPLTQRVVHDGGKVLGFNFLGSRWDHALLSRWIVEERPLDWVLSHLRDAQFDVELGRADLSRMVEREIPVALPELRRA